MPVLNETDQVLLESCMDEIRNVVGDTISERQLVETIMKHNFDYAKSLDVILNNAEASTTAAADTTSSAAKITTATTTQSAQPMETGNHKCLATFQDRHSIPSNTCLFDASSIFFSFYFSFFIYFHAFFGS